MSFIQSIEELEISKIKKISLIDTFSITTNSMSNSVLAIAVYYEDGKQLCYSELDAPFTYFYTTLKRIYEEEKDNGNITIDEETKVILQSNYDKDNLLNIKEQYGIELKTILPLSSDVNADSAIIKYIYENMLSFLNRKVKVQSIKGMGHIYTLKYLEDDLKEETSFKSFIDEDKRTYIFPGIFEGRKELIIKIDNNNPLNITFTNRDETFFGNIKVNDKLGTITETVYINGKLTFMNTDKLEILENTPCEAILNKLNISGTKYKLPWDGIRIYNLEETKGQNTKIVETITAIDLLENGNLRITSNNRETLIIENFKNVRGIMNLKSIDETSVINIYYIGEDEKYIVLETTFKPSILGRGIYKSNLSGRTFYKVYKLSDLDLESIDLDLTGVKRYQLINESELKLIKRRGDN